MPSGLAAVSIAASALPTGALIDSIQSRSVASGIQFRSFLAIRSSYEQPRAEIQPRGQDRPRRDRADVDIQQAGRGLHGSGSGSLDGGPADRERERQPDDQTEPHEQG